VGKVQASDRGDLQAAGLDPAVAAVAGVVGDGDLLPGQASQLLVAGEGRGKEVVEVTHDHPPGVESMPSFVKSGRSPNVVAERPILDGAQDHLT
jgi:hypothetical protein